MQIDGDPSVNHCTENRCVDKSGIVEVAFRLYIICKIVYPSVELKLSQSFGCSEIPQCKWIGFFDFGYISQDRVGVLIIIIYIYLSLVIACKCKGPGSRGIFQFQISCKRRESGYIFAYSGILCLLPVGPYMFIFPLSEIPSFLRTSSLVLPAED